MIFGLFERLRDIAHLSNPPHLSCLCTPTRYSGIPLKPLLPPLLTCHSPRPASPGNFTPWPATVKFAISFISIIPLAKLLGDATEQVSMSLGQTLGGLLNATFGNAVELIVGVVALTQGQLRLVQTSMLGSILSNLLLVLGCSFAAAGLNFKESTFQMTGALASSSLMTLACITLVIPAACEFATTTSFCFVFFSREKRIDVFHLFVRPLPRLTRPKKIGMTLVLYFLPFRSPRHLLGRQDSSRRKHRHQPLIPSDPIHARNL